MTFTPGELRETKRLTASAVKEINHLLAGLGFDSVPLDIRHWGFLPSEGLSNEYTRLLSL